MENENVLDINSAIVCCDYSLGEKTIKIPKAIDIENIRYLVRGPIISNRNLISLANYTILRSDDDYIHVSADVWNVLDPDFDGDLVYTLGGKK